MLSAPMRWLWLELKCGSLRSSYWYYFHFSRSCRSLCRGMFGEFSAESEPSKPLSGECNNEDRADLWPGWDHPQHDIKLSSDQLQHSNVALLLPAVIRKLFDTNRDVITSVQLFCLIFQRLISWRILHNQFNLHHNLRVSSDMIYPTPLPPLLFFTLQYSQNSRSEFWPQKINNEQLSWMNPRIVLLWFMSLWAISLACKNY